MLIIALPSIWATVNHGSDKDVAASHKYSARYFGIYMYIYNSLEHIPLLKPLMKNILSSNFL